MKTTDIILEYTNGEKNLEETNAALKEAGAGFHLDPKKNWLSPDEIVNGTAGLLDTGTGSLDKVGIDPETMEITNGDMGDAFALCFYNGKTYEVKGKKLTER